MEFFLRTLKIAIKGEVTSFFLFATVSLQDVNS
jgi:hypothetical protein